MQYSYTDGAFFHFMDLRTYDMHTVSGSMVGEEQLKYLKENMECEVLVHDDAAIAVELPAFVELEVTGTEPGVRGDTAQGGTKPATLDRGGGSGSALRGGGRRAQGGSQGG